MPKRLAKDWLEKLGATKDEVTLAKKLVRAVAGEDAQGHGAIEVMYAFELHDVLRLLMRERRQPAAWVERLAQAWLEEADRIPKYEKYDHSVKHVKAAVLVGERCYRTLRQELLDAAAKAGAR